MIYNSKPPTHQAQYEIGFFLWSRAKLVDVLDHKAVTQYGHIASSLMFSFYGDQNATDNAHAISQDISEWLSLLDDTPKMGFDYGVKTPLNSLTKIASTHFNQPLEYADINKPYKETGWFLYEKLKALEGADKDTLGSYSDLVYALLEHKDRDFDAQLAPGFINDLCVWMELYEEGLPHASTFGDTLKSKYEFLQIPYKNKDHTERRTHIAEYELSYYLWSRMKLCDVTNLDTVRGYRGITSVLSTAFQQDKLHGSNYDMMRSLTIALELLESYPDRGYTVAATIDSYDYYETMARMYDTPVEYVDIEQPVIETARFLYEKANSLTPNDSKIAKSFSDAIEVLLSAKDSNFETQLPGFLAQMQQWLASPEAGNGGSAKTIRAQYPLLFTAKRSPK